VSEELSGEDLVLIVEALDAFIPRRPQDVAPHERHDYEGFLRLKARLREHVGMHLSDSPRWWLTQVLRAERTALSQALLAYLLKQMGREKITRGEFRDALVYALSTLSDFQFFKPGVSLTPNLFAINKPPELDEMPPRRRRRGRA
jgi:hypothetical protein